MDSGWQKGFFNVSEEETKKQKSERYQTQETPKGTQKMGIKREEGISATLIKEEQPRKVTQTEEAAAVRQFVLPQYQEEQAQVLVAFAELKEEFKKLRLENGNLRAQLAELKEWKECIQEVYGQEQNGLYNEIGAVNKNVRSISIALGIPDEADVEAYSN